MLPRFCFPLLAITFSSSLLAADPAVTRHFSGHWDQPDQESQGLIFQVIGQPAGGRKAVVYWFTYADDLESAWYLGIGDIEGSDVTLDLYQSSGVGFMAQDLPGNASVERVGTMDITFLSCNEGLVAYSGDDVTLGGGEFAISRLSSILNTECTGGIADDTAENAPKVSEQILLAPGRAGISGTGLAEFDQTPDASSFTVSVDGLPDGNYQLMVGGRVRGGFEVSAGSGGTAFSSPQTVDTGLLTFDPRLQAIEVTDASGSVLTDGTASVDDDDSSSDEDSASDDEDSISEDEDSVSEDEDSVSEDEDSASEDEDSASEDEDSVSEDEDSASEDEDSVSEDEDSTSDDEDSVSEDEDSASEDEDSVSEDEDSESGESSEQP